MFLWLRIQKTSLYVSRTVINRIPSTTSTTSTTPIRCISNNSLQDVLLSKSLTSKPPENEFIKCSVFDSKGDIVMHGTDIKRLHFMKSHGLTSRDLRKILKYLSSKSTSYMNLEVVPSIVTRANCILLNLVNIRAMIKSDTVILFDSVHSLDSGVGLNQSYSYSKLLRDMHQGLSKPNYSSRYLPYEFRALEIILNHATNDLNSEMNVHTTVLQNVLNGLENSIESYNLRYLLIESKKMTQFHRKVKLVRNALDEVLENDDSLNELYLTEPRIHNNHEEVEFLLENYHVTCDEIVQKVENLISQTKSTNEIINIILDSNRNEMMLLGLKFGVGLLSMGVALYVAALYGMNLENFIEETDYGLPGVITFGSALLIILLLVSVKKVKKLQKITMTGGKDDKVKL